MARTPSKIQLMRLLECSLTPSQVLQLHAQLITTSFVAESLATTRLLAVIASKFLNMGYAELVYSQIDKPTTFMCNSMVIGYVKASNHEKAIHFYKKMRQEGTLGDFYTHPCLLKACGIVLGLVEGMQVHGDVTKTGLDSDLFVVNGLISMYCRCGNVGKAKLLFDVFPWKDLVSWNSMLAGYVGIGALADAHRLFDEMPDKDVYSWSIMIEGYGKKYVDADRARCLFDLMPIRDMVAWNSMINVYSKVGNMVAARQLFSAMPGRNVTSWSIMIDGYAQHGDPLEALNLFRQMLCYGTKPDTISFVGAVMASGQLGALDQGRWIHIYMKKNRIVMDLVVQTSLVDMYMKCGSLEEARRVFNDMSGRSTISWTVMLSGLGTNGLGREALEYFANMEREKVQMDDLIFLAVLTACSHAGLVSEGLHMFDKMRTVYGINPKIEHYGCLVDLFGRAGKLDRALNIIETMPFKPNAAIWTTLLLACRTHQNMSLAEVITKRLSELEADEGGIHVLMSNIYAETGAWDGVQASRKLIRERNVVKKTGRSVIEINGRIEVFSSGEVLHLQNEEMKAVIRSFKNDNAELTQ